MTYFPLHQTTCFFIPLVAPCKPLLVVFNKDNKNFAGIQQQVQNWIKENCKSYTQWNSNIWDCVKYREDTGRDVRLAIALYDVSIKELPSSKKN